MCSTFTLPDRYEPLTVVRYGPLSSVLRARDHRRGLDVAIKMLRPPAWLTPAEQKDWREQSVTALHHYLGVWHPNLALVRQVGQHAGFVYVVREWLPCEPLSEAGRLSLAEAYSVTRDAAAALDVLARRGLRHGALKPANVFVDPEGVVRITDPGCTTAVATIQVAGLRCRVDCGVPHDNDVTSLAALLVQLVTGEPPVMSEHGFVGEDRFPVAARHAIRRALACRTGGFHRAGDFVQALLPASPGRLVQAAWQPAAAVGVLVALATVGDLAISQVPAKPAAVHKRAVAAVSRPVTMVQPAVPELAAALSEADRAALCSLVRRYGPAALTYPAVADSFRLTAAQALEVRSLLSEQRLRVARLVDAMADGAQSDTWAPMAAARDEARARLLQLLSPVQRALWAYTEGSVPGDRHGI